MDTVKIDGGELVTIREALTRIGLEDLLRQGHDDYTAQDLVLWRGYPKPFACGHTRDALPEGIQTDVTRRERVNQAWAGGAILFSFPRYGSGRVNGNGPVYHYALASSLVVCSDRLNNGDHVLFMGITA